MIKKIQKVIPYFLASAMLFSSTAVNVSAKDTASTTSPDVTYGYTGIQNMTTYQFANAANKWEIRSTANRYSDWDKDSFNCYPSQANVSLSLSTTSTVSFEGSLSFDFAKIVKANLGLSAGQSWTRTSTVTYDATKGYKYTLWAANVQDITFWEYLSTSQSPYGLQKTTVYGKGGSEKWFFRTKL